MAAQPPVAAAWKQVSDKLFIGNYTCAEAIFKASRGYKLGVQSELSYITCIFVLTHVPVEIPADLKNDIVCKYFTVHNEELSTDEYHSARIRLDIAVENIQKAHALGHEIMIICETGHEQSAWLITYYNIITGRTFTSAQINRAIDTTSALYMTPAEVAEFNALDRQKQDHLHDEEFKLADVKQERYAQLRAKRCLNMRSYRAFLLSISY